eukprot:5631776-Alexandrium_andersonii.AAC.1
MASIIGAATCPVVELRLACDQVEVAQKSDADEVGCDLSLLRAFSDLPQGKGLLLHARSCAEKRQSEMDFVDL